MLLVDFSIVSIALPSMESELHLWLRKANGS